MGIFNELDTVTDETVLQQLKESDRLAKMEEKRKKDEEKRKKDEEDRKAKEMQRQKILKEIEECLDSQNNDIPTIYETFKEINIGGEPYHTGGPPPRITYIRKYLESEYISTPKRNFIEQYLLKKLNKNVHSNINREVSSESIKKWPSEVPDEQRTYGSRTVAERDNYYLSFERVELEKLRTQIDNIKSSEDPMLDAKGTITFLIMEKSEEIETTFKNALLALGEDGVVEFFKTNDEKLNEVLEERRQEKIRQEKIRQEEEKKAEEARKEMERQEEEARQAEEKRKTAEKMPTKDDKKTISFKDIIRAIANALEIGK